MMSNSDKPAVNWEKLWKEIDLECDQVFQIKATLMTRREHYQRGKNHDVYESCRFHCEKLYKEKQLILKRVVEEELERRIKDPEFHEEQSKKYQELIEKYPLPSQEQLDSDDSDIQEGLDKLRDLGVLEEKEQKEQEKKD